MKNKDITTYKSVDTLQNEYSPLEYTLEFLNSIELSGMPSHILELKIGIILINYIYYF